MSEEYDDNEYEDSGERAANELEEVHSTLREILSTLQSRPSIGGWLFVAFIILVIV